MKYTITGGAGFIGSHLVDALVSQGHEVTVLDDLSSGSIKNIGHHIKSDLITPIIGSIIDPEYVLDATPRGTDGVFHEAALTSVQQSIKNPQQTYEVNSAGTGIVLDVAKRNKVGKVVFASSAAIYGDTKTLPKTENIFPMPLSPYAKSKLDGEYLCNTFSQVYGLPTVCLRYFNVFGPRQNPASEYAAVIPKTIARLLAGEPPIIYGDGNQTRDFVFVKDVVRANIMAMESCNTGTYNIGSGKETPVNTLVSLLSGIINPDLKPIYQEKKEGDIYRSVADIGLAKRSFGYEPEYDIDTVLKETVNWYRGSA